MNNWNGMWAAIAVIVLSMAGCEAIDRYAKSQVEIAKIQLVTQGVKK